MPKQRSNPAPAAKRAVRAGAARRGPVPAVPGETTAVPTSVEARLAAEVDRLERELSAARAQLVEAEARADVDALTGLLNRRGFERELRRALAYRKRYGGPMALLYVDLDNFKPVNDRYGHAAGDAVLRAVAATLTREVRASDAVGRIGGDEFAVLLWNIEEQQAAAKAGRLEDAIAAAPGQPGRFTMGASIGLAVLDPSSSEAEALARADRAMYVRKAARKGGPATASANVLKTLGDDIGG